MSSQMFVAYRFIGPAKKADESWKRVLVVGQDDDPNYLWIKNSAAQHAATRVMFSMIYCAADEKGHRATFNWKTALAEKAAKDSVAKTEIEREAAEREAAEKEAARIEAERE